MHHQLSDWNVFGCRFPHRLCARPQWRQMRRHQRMPQVAMHRTPILMVVCNEPASVHNYLLNQLLLLLLLLWIEETLRRRLSEVDQDQDPDQEPAMRSCSWWWDPETRFRSRCLAWTSHRGRRFLSCKPNPVCWNAWFPTPHLVWNQRFSSVVVLMFFTWYSSVPSSLSLFSSQLHCPLVDLWFRGAFKFRCHDMIVRRFFGCLLEISSIGFGSSITYSISTAQLEHPIFMECLISTRI